LVTAQVLLEVMKRMDVLIFHFLINPPSDALSEGGSSAVSSHQPDSPSSRDGVEAQQQVLRDTINPNMPMLDDSMLFFTRGVLTFGTGMNLKMACTRWAWGKATASKQPVDVAAGSSARTALHEQQRTLADARCVLLQASHSRMPDHVWLPPGSAAYVIAGCTAPGCLKGARCAHAAHAAVRGSTTASFPPLSCLPHFSV
jgi:hypothetical protein